MEARLEIQPVLTSCRYVRVATNEELLFIENIKPRLMEMINIYANGKKLRGQIIEISGNIAVAQVFDSLSGINLNQVRVECTGEVFKMSVSEDMIGGFFDGSGRPRDKTFVSYPEKKMEIEGRPINPIARRWPQGVILTGIGTIDLMNTIAVGHVYTIYSAAGLPHNELVAQIICQATIVVPPYNNAGDVSDELHIVFAGMDMSNEAIQFFTAEFQESKHPVTSFMHSANDAYYEHILTPRLALTFAEYLAFEKQKHVMVVINDMSNYCHTMQIIDRSMVSSKPKYTSYVSSDVASLLDRGGTVQGSSGSLTIMPVMTVPADDMTHPVVDVVGSHTDNSLVLSRRLHNLGIYPPIDVMAFYKLPKFVWELTRDDHIAVIRQLDVLYDRAHVMAGYKAVVGESMYPEELLYLRFKEAFDQRMIKQRNDESRDLMKSFELAWELLRMFPRDMLSMWPKYLDQYYPK